MPVFAEITSVYKLDESSGNAIDLRGNTLTAVGGPTSGAGNIYPTARQLTYPGQYFEAANSSVFTFDSAQSVTFAVWVKRGGAGSGFLMMLSKDDGGSSRECGLYLNLGASQVTWEVSPNGSSMNTVQYGHSLPIGEWHLVVAGRDAATNEIFVSVDANPRATAASATTFSGAAKFRLGSRVSGGHEWDGQMGPMFVFPYALTASQVKGIYRDSAGFQYAPPFDLTSGPSASCHFSLDTFRATSSPEVGDGTEDINLWSPPDNFTPDQYLDALVAGGFTSVYFTSKHLSDFCLWPSVEQSERALPATDWAVRTGRNNVLLELVTGARARGIRVGFYFPMTAPYVKAKFGGEFNADYKASQFAQIREILDPIIFGLIDFFLIDWYGPLGAPASVDYPDIPYQETLDVIAEKQPNCWVLINAVVPVPGGIANGGLSDVFAYEGTFQGEPAPGITSRPVFHSRPFQLTDRWFTRADADPEPLGPALRMAAHRRQRMTRRGYCGSFNVSPGPTGELPADLLAIVNAFGSATVRDLADGLESLWIYDQDTNGGSDYVNHSTLVANVEAPLQVTGARGGAWSLFGGGYLSCAENQSLSIGNASASWQPYPFCWAGWFKATAVSGTPFIFAKDNNGVTVEYGLFIDSGNSNRLTWRISPDGGSTLVNVAGRSINSAQEYFFVTRFDPLTHEASLKVDSDDWVTVGSVPAFTDPYWTPVPLTIGCRGTGNLPFTGLIGEGLAFWRGRLLDDSDAAALFAGAAGFADVSYGRGRGPLFRGRVFDEGRLFSGVIG